MNKNAWGERIAQLLGIVCVIFVLSSIWPGWENILSILEKRDAPSWAQAIGSILAIVGAVGIASWQYLKEIHEKSLDAKRKEIHYCEICLQMCQAAFSVVRSAEDIEDKLLEVGNDKDKFKIHWERYTSVERIDNIQASLIALLGKDMSSDLMKHIFSLQKYIAIYRESMILAKVNFDYWQELDILDQKNNLRNDVDKIYKKLIAYRTQLVHR